jgi:hypothetical protein
MPPHRPPAASPGNDLLLAFRCACLRFRLRVVSRLELPPEKGSTIHGALGHVLRQQAPLAYRCLYEPAGAQPGLAHDAPRPFALLPPQETRTVYPEGSELALDLTLFGHTIGQLAVCVEAIATLGSVGLGRDRGRFEVVEVETLRPDGDPITVYRGDTRRFLASPEGVSGAAIAATHAGREASGLTLRLVTRLRLKDQQHLVRHAPPFATLMQRLLERAEALGMLYHRDAMLDTETRQGLLEQARAVEIAGHDLYWDDWSRYSGRQHTWMKFGGLLGSITYRGELGPFLPWLALGEWMHIGGKTSFGLGRYKLL